MPVQRRRSRPASRETARSRGTVIKRTRTDGLPLSSVGQVSYMSVNDKIPFLDLVSPHLELEEELVSVFRTAIRTAGFVGGPMVDEFERDFANYCGTRHCVGVANGTDALRFAIMAAGVRPGDTVVTVPNTFIAT